MQKNKKALDNPPLRKGRVERSDDMPYANLWMDSCYQETLLPDLAWTKVKPRVCEQLAKRIQKQENQEERMQMILELVGPEFKKEYFPDIPYQPSLLEPPHMTQEQRDKLRSEAQVWLNSQAYRAAKESGCGRVLPGTEPSDDLCDEQMRFLQNVFDIFVKGLDRHLYRYELELMKEKREKEEAEKKKSKGKEDKSRVQVLAVRRASMLSAVSSAYSRKSTPFYDKVTRIGGEEPGYYSEQSEAVGESVKTVLQRDPRRFMDISRRLHGRQLPASLRSYMWLDVLFKNDRERLKEGNVEKIVRERFGRAVARGVGELGMKRATHSPIAGLIENAVVERYNKTLAMQPYNFEKHLVDTARALNILYTYDRTYEPYLIHWLFPMQVAFKEQSQAGEHVYELGMYLDLLNQNFFPSWPKVFAMAEQTLDILLQFDSVFYNHLKSISQIDADVNTKEFMVYLIHQEKEKAQEIIRSSQKEPMTPRSQESMKMSRPLLADPLIFLRKWIGEGFVSVLDTPAVLFLWDQNFMQLWQGHTMENMCLALLMLLRHKFMEAHNYPTMKDVFLNAPCCLYTADIQRAWIHMELGKTLNDVPYLNRQRPVTPPPTPGLSATPRPGTTVIQGPLLPIGIRNINVKLIIPDIAWQNETWMSQFNPNRIKLMCKVFFGPYKLDMKISHETSYFMEGDSTPRGSKIFALDFTADEFVFLDLDASKYRMYADSYPYAIVRVDYLQVYGERKLSVSHTPLGWAKIPLYTKVPKSQQQPTSPSQQTPGRTQTRNTPGGGTPGGTGQGYGTPRDGTRRPTPYGQEASQRNTPKSQRKEELSYTWFGMWGDRTYPLTAGAVPTSVVQAPSRPPTTEAQGIINPGSEITCTIFDPGTTPPPEKVQTPKKTPPREPTPKAREPTPKPKTPVATPDDRAWVPFKALAAKNDPDPMDLNSTFDIYVDMVRFIPDLASIIKVTGRVLRTGEVSNIQDILAYPEVPNDPRSPTFRYRQTVNEVKKTMDQNALVLFRVYTVQNDNRDLVVLGSCLFGLCSNEGKIKTGGYQLRLRKGMPELPGGIAGLQPNDMANNTSVPCTSILIRILPHESVHVNAPEYRKCYYHSDDASPNKSEWGIFDNYQSDTQFPNNYVDMVRKVKAADKDTTATSQQTVKQYMARRLDNKKYLAPQTPAKQIDLSISVRYRRNIGMGVTIQKAFGMKENCYIQCSVKEVKSSQQGRTSRSTARDVLRYLTNKLDFTTSQKTPQWTDKPTSFKPEYNKNSFLEVQVYAMSVAYKPDASHNKPGTLTGAGGQPFDLSADAEWYWTAIPLFKWESTWNGVHIAPLFKGRMSSDMRSQILEKGVEEVMYKTDWDETKLAGSSGLVVKLLDNQYQEKDFPIQPLHEQKLVNALGNPEPYLSAMRDTSGKRMSDLVLESLTSDERRGGATGNVYETEEKYFAQVTQQALKEEIESVDGPLPNTGN